MSLKGDAKFKGKLDPCLKNDKRNYLVNFHERSWKSEKLHFDGLILSKAYKVLDEEVQESYLSWHWRVIQSLTKNWLLVPNDMRNFVNYNASSGKPDKLQFDVLLLSIAYKVSAKRCRKVISHDTEEWAKL